MIARKPVEEYWDAYRAYARGQDGENWKEWVSRISEIKGRWSACFPLLLELARGTEPEVWFTLGDAFLHGRGTTQDRDEGARWLTQAAEAGNLHAMNRLALLLQLPRTFEGDSDALVWYRRAAEQGDSRAMVSLGFCYRDGTGVPVDMAQAAEWFIRAVEAGDTHALVHAGRVYANHLCSPVEAERCFLQAAAAGHSDGRTDSRRFLQQP